MADNVMTNPGSGGATLATDELPGGVHFPFSKLAFGPRNTATEVQDADGQRLPVAADPDLLTTAVLLLSAILEKLPRIDAADRLMVNASEVAAANANITTVTTLTALSNLGALSRPADAVPMHVGNAGSLHIYDRIVVA